MFDADLSDLRSAGAAARGIDTIFYAVGVPVPFPPVAPGDDSHSLRSRGIDRGPRLVLVSNVYPYGVPRTSHVAETHPREPETRKGKFRKEQEDAVLEAHAKGRMRRMVVRLPDFYGPHADLAWRIRFSARR